MPMSGQPIVVSVRLMCMAPIARVMPLLVLLALAINALSGCSGSPATSTPVVSSRQGMSPTSGIATHQATPCAEYCATAVEASRGWHGNNEVMTHGIELVAGSALRTRTAVRAFEEPFNEAVAACSARLQAEAIEVHLIEAPDEVIPEWGLGGYTYGPHTVVIAVDPDHVLDPRHVFSTVVHEIHHAMRSRPRARLDVG
jgi:hypothetical protein